MDYTVRAYTNDDDTVLEWTIQDRTEDEARREAESEIAMMDNIEDWTLTPLITEAGA